LGFVAPELPVDDLEIRVDTIRLAIPFNSLGWPALALPCGPAEDGLPASLQIAGRPGSDALVLAAGKLVEALLPETPEERPQANARRAAASYTGSRPNSSSSAESRSLDVGCSRGAEQDLSSTTISVTSSPSSCSSSTFRWRRERSQPTRSDASATGPRTRSSR